MKWGNLKKIMVVFLPLCLSACVSQSNVMNFDKQQAAKARVELGLGYLNQQNPVQAKLNLDKAFSYAPDYYLTHSALAYFYQQQGDIEQAKRFYLSAIEQDSNQGDVFNNYGALLCSQGEFALARQQFQRALDTSHYYNQADTYENLILCGLSEKNTALYDTYFPLLEKLAPERAVKLRKLKSVE